MPLKREAKFIPHISKDGIKNLLSINQNHTNRGISVVLCLYLQRTEEAKSLISLMHVKSFYPLFVWYFEHEELKSGSVLFISISINKQTKVVTNEKLKYIGCFIK